MERNLLWQAFVGDSNSPYVAISEDGIEISNGTTVYVKSVGDWHKAAIDAENAQDQRNYGMQGDTIVSVGQMIEQSRKETIAEVRQIIDAEFDKTAEKILTMNISGRPSRGERIANYLHLLYEAQKVDHNVHKEIEEALARFKLEAGI